MKQPVTLKCRIAFVVTLLASYAIIPAPKPFRHLHAGIEGSQESQWSYAPTVTTMPVCQLNSAVTTATLTTTGLTTSAMLVVPATGTTGALVTDSETASLPIRHAPITLAAGSVK